MAGLALPATNSIPCLAPLAIALWTSKLWPPSRNMEGMLSVTNGVEEEEDLTTRGEDGGGLPGMGEGVGDIFFFGFLGIV